MRNTTEGDTLNWKRFWVVGGTLFLGLPLMLYGWLHFCRPPRTNIEQTLFQGIAYQREVRSIPRPMTIHIVTIDLKTPGIKVLVTPGKLASDRTATEARTTSEFLNEFKLQLAINANYFYPFRENTPWDYYPGSGDRVGVVGQAIGNGNSYAPIKRNWPVLCFDSKNRAQILASGNCPVDTVQAIAGSNLLVDKGKAIVPNPDEPDKPYARVALAIDRQGDKLWLVLVDGKQPFYSEGIKAVELVKIFEELGVYTAVNLDGGGSTTLVMATSSAPKLLNAPIHTKLPMRERPVANHLGFYALPIPTENMVR
jgi:hypothetical protein